MMQHPDEREHTRIHFRTFKGREPSSEQELDEFIALLDKLERGLCPNPQRESQAMTPRGPAGFKSPFVGDDFTYEVFDLAQETHSHEK